MREIVSKIFITVCSSLRPLEALGLRSVLHEYPKESSIRWVLTHAHAEESVVKLSCDAQKTWVDTEKVHLEIKTSLNRLNDKWLKDVQSALLALMDSESDVRAMLDRHNIEHPVNWDVVMEVNEARLLEFTKMFKAPLHILNPLLTK